MPHASNIFSKYHASSTGHQDSSDKTRPQRNRLKKRLPFGYSEANVVSYDLSKLMGNHHSIQEVPRPTRPPRPSATDIPDLPGSGLPIYKTFAPDYRPTTLLGHDLKPSLPVQNDKPFESATGWVLANSPTPVPGEQGHENIQPSLERQGNHETASATIPIPRRPPQYDRASRLAESYQSLLPDLDSMEYPEAHSAYPEAHSAPHRQHSDQRLRHHDQWHQRYNARNGAHHLRHAPRPETAPTTPGFWRPPHPGSDISYPPRSSGRGTHSGRASSIITDSSATAVESDGSPFDRFSTASEMFPIQGVTQIKDCAHVTDKSNSNSESETQYMSYRKELAEKRTSSPRKDVRDRDRPRLSSSDYVGLQICSELLTDELLKTFFRQHPSEKRGRASKLQVLLLIEAYEAMLDNCRKELLNVPLRSNSAEKERERGQRRKHVRDAVRILDHWLDSLYVIYDETFGDLPEGAGSGAGGKRRVARESARVPGSEAAFRGNIQGVGF